jgi:hypothetical protein
MIYTFEPSGLTNKAQYEMQRFQTAQGDGFCLEIV